MNSCNRKKIIARCLCLVICIVLSHALSLSAITAEIAGNSKRAHTGQEEDEARARDLYATVLHVQAYGSRMTWEKQWEAAQWLQSLLSSSGISAEVHSYESGGKTWPNVVARLTGRKHPEEIVMLIAHLDSTSDDPQKGAPGADDNAGGLAVLLEAARILKGISLDRTIMFCIFSNEERGQAGSRAFAHAAKEKGMDIKAVINLDILGYNRPRSPFYLSAVTAHRSLTYQLKAIYRMAEGYVTGLFMGDNVIKVVGKEPNRELVAATARAFRASSGLKVREVVRNDCG